MPKEQGVIHLPVIIFLVGLLAFLILLITSLDTNLFQRLTGEREEVLGTTDYNP